MQVAPEPPPLLLPRRDQTLPRDLELAVGGDRLHEGTDLGPHVLEQPPVPRSERVVAGVDLDPEASHRGAADGEVDGRGRARRGTDRGGDRPGGGRGQHVDGGEREVEAPGEQLEGLAQRVLGRGQRVEPAQVRHHPVRELAVAVDHPPHGPLDRDARGQEQQRQQPAGQHRAGGDVRRGVHRPHRAGERGSHDDQHERLDEPAADPRLDLAEVVAPRGHRDAGHGEPAAEQDEHVLAQQRRAGEEVGDGAEHQPRADTGADAEEGEPGGQHVGPPAGPQVGERRDHEQGRDGGPQGRRPDGRQHPLPLQRRVGPVGERGHPDGVPHRGGGEQRCRHPPAAALRPGQQRDSEHQRHEAEGGHRLADGRGPGAAAHRRGRRRRGPAGWTSASQAAARRRRGTPMRALSTALTRRRGSPARAAGPAGAPRAGRPAPPRRAGSGAA